MQSSRRAFLQSCGALGIGALCRPAWAWSSAAPQRTFHTTASCKAIESDAELLPTIAAAGVGHLWFTGFWAGNWVDSPERIQALRARCEKHGLAAHIINVPLGHPDCGNPHWPRAVRPDGSTYTGVSLHAPATPSNGRAMQQIQTAGIDRAFVDDDFRVATGPGVIGGCFCDEHKREFLQRGGFRETPDWPDLLEAVKQRRFTPILRAWVDDQCDRLSACFRAQRQAAPQVSLGIMVMYMGAEKAGVRLRDYTDVPFRVGEFMFSDDAFAPVKGKTSELFSALFHRRFVRPELAFSETTAFPDKRLSLKNKIAKLAVSTLSDVRNTMFMCDFPKEHWPALGPAMKRHAQIHEVLAGHTPRGPLKHFWGEAGRYVSDDNPYSLWLALGVPFEVAAEPPHDGFAFLADADAQVLEQLPATGTTWIARKSFGPQGRAKPLPEALPELFAWKQSLLPQLGKTPYVEGQTPVVCAWYPTARAVLLWNLTEQPQELTVRCGDARRTVRVDALDVALLEDIVV